ncbi:hypothetical protein K9M47_02965 [Candidatus Gracilibacteria bacterium]|nr:hypothetical protein [Candidatus Gracilibacteria bacterium]MCF7898510.1 hypothetical protein [Candidatus Paceibacterota bacterium]
MTYLSGRANKRKKTFEYITYGTFFIVVIFFWSFFKSSTYPIVEPVVIKYSLVKKSFSEFPEFIHTYATSRDVLVKRDKELEVEIEYLENKIASKEAELKEMGLVLEETGGMSPETIIVMYPLMQDVTRLYSTILLSKGYKDGVEKDAYVYVRGLQPVCIIKEVYTSTSLCELISKDGVVTEAVVGNSTSTIAVTLTGRGGGTFLGNVARDTPISIGEDVYLKSDQSMKLGTVVDVMHNNQDTSWRVFVSGSYNPLTSSIFYTHK